MTLIAGTRVWKGVCLATDTRVTYKPSSGVAFYKDDCQKCEMVTGGLAISVAGDGKTSSLFFDSLKKNHVKTYQRYVDKRLNGEEIRDEPEDVAKAVIRESLREVANMPEVMSRPASETKISGLIGLVDSIPLRLKQVECQNIMRALEYARNVNAFVGRNLPQIIDCANGSRAYVEFSEFTQNALFTYESVLGSSSTNAVLEVKPVPFGQVAVFGSGVSIDHAVQQFHTLGYILLETDTENVHDAAFHLTRTHGWSDIVVPVDRRYGFKTFGGASLATVLMTDPASPTNVELVLLTGDFHRKSDGKIISSVYERADKKLCAKGEDGKENVLIPFSQYPSSSSFDIDL